MAQLVVNSINQNTCATMKLEYMLDTDICSIIHIIGRARVII
jgi:hypothetical protein